MTDKQIIIDGVDVSEWPDEEVRYKLEKHSPKAIRQIAFDLYKQLKRKEQLSVKQSHELIRLRKERQENKQKNGNLLQKNEELEKQLENEKQALDKIENYVRDNSDFDKNDKLTSNTGAYDILEIINKAKDGE